MFLSRRMGIAIRICLVGPHSCPHFTRTRRTHTHDSSYPVQRLWSKCRRHEEWFIAINLLLNIQFTLGKVIAFVYFVHCFRHSALSMFTERVFWSNDSELITRGLCSVPAFCVDSILCDFVSVCFLSLLLSSSRPDFLSAKLEISILFISWHAYLGSAMTYEHVKNLFYWSLSVKFRVN